MPELTDSNNKIINAVVDRKAEFVKVADWDGKSLSFILADEIISEENPNFSDPPIIKG